MDLDIEDYVEPKPSAPSSDSELEAAAEKPAPRKSTRKKEEPHMIYVLVLNDMRASQIEAVLPRAWSSSREDLERFMVNERVESYIDADGDQRWCKSFRKGGPLEWCNPPPDDLSRTGFHGEGIRPIRADVIDGVPMYPAAPVTVLDGIPRIDG